MKTLELEGHIDDKHQLHINVPADVQPGPVRVLLEIESKKAEDDLWRMVVWEPELSDPREDIYTLEDGQPERLLLRL